LCGIRAAAPRQVPHRPAQNSKPGERLKRVSGISPKSNINCTEESCGKLAAKQFSQIFVAAKA
jgi:hypothetical protein